MSNREHILHTILFAMLTVAMVALALGGLLVGTTQVPLADVGSTYEWRC